MRYAETETRMEDSSTDQNQTPGAQASGREPVVGKQRAHRLEHGVAPRAEVEHRAVLDAPQELRVQEASACARVGACVGRVSRRYDMIRHEKGGRTGGG